MKTAFTWLFCFLCVHPIIDAQMPLGGITATASGGGSGTVSIDGTHHGAATTTSISATYSAGDTVWAVISACATTGCVSATACTVTATGGTNGAYTALTAVNFGTSWNSWGFYFAGVTGTSETITFAISGTGCTAFGYPQTYFIALKSSLGRPPTYDSSAGVGSATNNAGTYTVTSPGNVSVSGELGIGYINDTSPTFSGGYTVLDAASSNDHDATSTTLTSGSANVFTGNASGTWFATDVAFKP